MGTMIYGNTIFSFRTIGEAVIIIKHFYNENDVVLGELFPSIIINANIETVLMVVKEARLAIDGFSPTEWAEFL